MKDPCKSAAHQQAAARAVRAEHRVECEQMDSNPTTDRPDPLNEDALILAYNQGWEEGREEERAFIRDTCGSLAGLESRAEAYNLGWRLGSQLMVATLLDELKNLTLTFADTQDRIERGELATKQEISEDIRVKLRMVKNYVAVMQERFSSLKDVREEIARVVPRELMEESQ